MAKIRGKVPAVACDRVDDFPGPDAGLRAGMGAHGLLQGRCRGRHGFEQRFRFVAQSYLGVAELLDERRDVRLRPARHGLGAKLPRQHECGEPECSHRVAGGVAFPAKHPFET